MINSSKCNALVAVVAALAAVLALASTEAGAAQPLQSPVAPTPTRSRWRDRPATPTPDYSQAQHGRIRDARYQLHLPLIGN